MGLLKPANSGGGGASGTSGFSGFSGASGTSGASGVSGTSGASGFSGTSGVSGKSGFSGVSGVSGFSGASGTSGTSGFSGASGTSGVSGASGTSGVSGRSGFSGASGTSGTAPANVVTTDTDQTITGTKTFDAPIYGVFPTDPVIRWAIGYDTPSDVTGIVVANGSSPLAYIDYTGAINCRIVSTPFISNNDAGVTINDVTGLIMSGSGGTGDGGNINVNGGAIINAGAISVTTSSASGDIGSDGVQITISRPIDMLGNTVNMDGGAIASAASITCNGTTETATLTVNTGPSTISGGLDLDGADLTMSGGGISLISKLYLSEQSATPSAPATSAAANVYMKADKLVIQYQDGATLRYKFLDLTGTGVTWVHTTTAP
jgi:collagen type VII alpha